jgi:CheY-like chemotaxis protein
MRLLYVDDDALLREVAEMALSLDPEVEVWLAEDGPSALDLVRSGAWVPDAFLLDVMMPGMSGPQLLAELRALPEHAHTPAIFFTARAEANAREPLIAAGALGVLTKPFDAMTLAAQVRAMLDD